MKYIILPLTRLLGVVFISVVYSVFLLFALILVFVWTFSIKDVTSWVKEDLEKGYFMSADDSDYYVLSSGSPNLVYKTISDYILNRETKYKS